MSGHTLGDVFFQRTWWTADVRRDGAAIWLVVRQGSRHTAIWRSTLEPFSDQLRPSTKLEASVGDVFVCCGPSIDETLIATVVAVDGARLQVEFAAELEPTTTEVQLLTMHGLKTKKRKAA